MRTSLARHMALLAVGAIAQLVGNPVKASRSGAKPPLIVAGRPLVGKRRRGGGGSLHGGHMAPRMGYTPRLNAAAIRRGQARKVGRRAKIARAKGRR